MPPSRAHAPTATTHFGPASRVGPFQCLAHVLRDRPGDHQHVGVPERGDEAQAEAFQIVEGIVERMDFQLATVAGAGVHLADRQAAAEPPPRRRVELGGELGELHVARRWHGLGERRTYEALKQQLAHAPTRRRRSTSN
jgi:hypothetical protein